MANPRYIKHEGEILTYDHQDTGCPVYMAYDKDLWIKVFPDGARRPITPIPHHRTTAPAAIQLAAAMDRFMKPAQEGTK